jgi:hypothetical protein
LSNELTAEANLEVLKHLERCQDCAEALETRRRVKSALKQAFKQQEGAPAALRARILKSAKPSAAWRHWSLAAAVVLLTLGGWLVIRSVNFRPPSDLSAQANLNETPSAHNTEILKIGLGDHIHCALHRDFSKGPWSAERISHEMGEYLSLVPAVRERVPQDYTLMVAHRCNYQGRNFVHLILTRPETILSVILTRKNGAAFDESNLNTVLKASGVPLYQTRLQDLEVTGFETRDYLAYVVSGLNKEENLRLASNLAPSVREFLARLEG